MNDINNMESKKNILLSLIIGDTLGNTFTGHGKAHIESNIKNFNNFHDTETLLKGKMERWRKPALYSYITQFMFIISQSIERKNLSQKKFLKNLNFIHDQGNQFTLIRHAGNVEKQFFASMGMEKIKTEQPCPFLLPALAPISFFRNSTIQLIKSVTPLVKLFTDDIDTVTGSILYLSILNRIIQSNTDSATVNLYELTSDIIEKLLDDILKEQHIIFELKINPDYFINSLKSYKLIFHQLKTLSNIKDGEQIIIAEVNKTLKTDVTRANINNTKAILTFSILLIQENEINSSILFKIAKQGGSSSIITSISSSIMGSIYNYRQFSGDLDDELINKKKISLYIEYIEKNRFPHDFLTDFISSEKKLSETESNELKAKLKHIKPAKNVKKKKKISSESDLSKHIVESWGKIDKAKWKKERKKLNTD